MYLEYSDGERLISLIPKAYFILNIRIWLKGSFYPYFALTKDISSIFELKFYKFDCIEIVINYIDYKFN